METGTPLFGGLAFLAGVLTVLSPCILPVLPLLLGRSLQSHRLGPMALVLGLAGGFAIAGSLIGLASSWIGGLATLLRGVAIAVLLGLGLLALVPQWSYQLSAQFNGLLNARLNTHFPRLRKNLNARGGLWGEFWVGTQLGLLWTPCAGPVLGSIIVLAAVKHQIATSFGLLLLYGLGAGVPLLAIAYAGRYLSQSLLRLRAHSPAIQRIGGLLIVGSAIAILMGWDVQIQLWLAPFFPSLML